MKKRQKGNQTTNEHNHTTISVAHYCHLQGKSNCFFMHRHHAVYMNASPHPLFLETKTECVFGIIEEFRAIRSSFAKLALQETKKSTIILLIIYERKLCQMVRCILSIHHLVLRRKQMQFSLGSLIFIAGRDLGKRKIHLKVV